MELISTLKMRAFKTCLAALTLLFFSGTQSMAQITYSEVFTAGVTPTAAQATDWVNFRNALIVSNPYYRVRISSSLGGAIECNNATIVQDIALKLRTGVAGTWVDGTNTWNVGTCGSSTAGTGWELSVNNGNCLCSTGTAVRPGIGNSNWGGFTTNCSAPSQTLTVEFFFGPPCTAPSNLTATNITSTSATVGWTAVAPPSVNYQYVVNTTATPSLSMTGTTTTTTSHNVTGLTPNTTYYLHVKHFCASNSISQWVTYQFQTNPPCSRRNLFIKDVTADEAKVFWNKVPYALQYEYTIKLDPTLPGSGTTTTTTTDTSFAIDQLAEGTKYYVFVRVHCPGSEMSEWALDSFTTRTICRAPNLQVDHIEAHRAVVYWNKMPTAVGYEYEVSQSPTPLGNGTEIEKTNFYAFPLKDGNTYYFHVRSNCNDQGFKSQSEWTTTTFSTFPTSVGTTGGNNFGVSVHPNPLKDAVTITIGGKLAANAHVNIMNVRGQLVYSTDMSTNTISVDMSNLPSGIYTMKYTDENRSETIKLTKQ